MDKTWNLSQGLVLVTAFNDFALYTREIIRRPSLGLKEKGDRG